MLQAETLLIIYACNIYITYKIVYKSGADSSSRFGEIMIWKNKFKKF